MSVLVNTNLVNTKALAAMVAPFLALSLSACAFQKDPQAKVNNKIADLERQLEANRAIIPSDLTFEFEGLEPKQYKAKVSWPADRPQILRFTYQVSPESKALVRSVGPSLGSSTELSCVNSRLDFKVEVLSADLTILNSFDVEKDCPSDQVLTGETSHKELSPLLNGRLFLENGAAVLIENGPFALTVNEIIAKGPAKIVVNRKNREHGSNRSDGFAPEVIINAKKASGSLTFELNGTDGAEVPDLGGIHDFSLNGRPGKDAVVGRPAVLDSEKYLPRCMSEPTAGTPGLDAKKAKGDKGYAAKPGIGTSKLTLNIADVTGLTAEFVLNPGRKGNRGKGSVYLGGKGGAPGKAAIGLCANQPVQAPNGKNSERGDLGDDAVHGGCGDIVIPQALIAKRPVVKDINPNDAAPLYCSKNPDLIKAI